jgi:hypothetical protein
VSLELRDGRRITCIAVRPGGYVPPRKTDPPFDARDTVAVVRATEADCLAESERQSTGSTQLMPITCPGVLYLDRGAPGRPR